MTCVVSDSCKEMKSMEGNGGGQVVTELSHIRELVKQLEVHLQGSPALPAELCKQLMSQIFSCTERSLVMIKSASFAGRKRPAPDAGLDSPSPVSDVSDAAFRMNKRRKTMEKWKHQVRVSSVGVAENLIDDGHRWRKYGQKDILGATNPRAYYRCRHRNSQGCAATKHVQRSDEDPTLFDVVYHGAHTCVKTALPDHDGKGQQVHNPHAQSLLESLSSSLTVKTEGLAIEHQDCNPMSFTFSASTPVSGVASDQHNPFSLPSTPQNCFVQGVSTSLVSPATSDSNHIPLTQFWAAGDGEWPSEGSDLQEVMSALVAITGEPMPAIDMDFPMNYFEFDPSFGIDAPSFF